MSTISTTISTTYPIPTITSYTNLGPIPTTITFPPNCQTDVFDFNADGIGVPYTYYTQGCALSSCCPSSHVYSTAFEWYSNYYSPAVCPSGYTSGPADPIISTQSGETVKWCCPTSFDAPDVAALPAVATAPYLNGFCQRKYYNLSSSAFVYSDIFDQKFVSTESINSWYYLAYPFQIRWKSGDFDNIATLISSTSTPSGSSTSGLSQSIAPSTSSPTPVASTSKKAISTGAIAAIAVVLGVLFLIALTLLLWWLRRRSQMRAARSETNSRPLTPSKNRYAVAMQEDPYSHDAQPVISSVGGARYGHELDASEPIGELDASQRAELDTRSPPNRAELR